MGSIVWLASYPKSGNTWFRVFLANLLWGSNEPVSINDLDSIPIASDRDIFDNVTGVESSDLTAEEIERLRPQVYEHLAAKARETLFFKIHDAYTYTRDGCPLVSDKAARAAIYIVRNPLDVAASFAHHNGWNVDFTIAVMGDEEYAICSGANRLHVQLRQRILSWSGHVLSWTEAPGLPLHVVRYEDMKHNPLETFSQAVQFIGLASGPERIGRALAFSAFDEMQRQEQAGGFRGKLPQATSFFRKGEVGSWREVLTEQQAARIIADHGKVMRSLGYLTEDGTSVF